MNDDEFKRDIERFAMDIIEGIEDPASAEFGLLETIHKYKQEKELE